MQLFNSLCALLAFTCSALAQAPITPIYQFTNAFSGVGYTNIENVALRPNGNLLLNLVTEAIMVELNPLDPQPQVVVNISQAYVGAPGSLTGIVELWPDVYIVAAGNFSFGPQNPGGAAGIPGSFSVWEINLRGEKAVAKKVVDIPEANLLDGITKPAHAKNVVLIADSALGAIWRVDVSSGKYEKVLSSPLFLPGPAINFGINGLKVYGSNLYFTSSAQGYFGAIPFSPAGYPTGDIQILANSVNGTFFDDFTLSTDGYAYIATQRNSIYKVALAGGDPILVAGGGADMTLLAPTATIFGPDGRLYITTAGAFGAQGPVSGGVFAISVGGGPVNQGHGWEKWTA